MELERFMVIATENTTAPNFGSFFAGKSRLVKYDNSARFMKQAEQCIAPILVVSDLCVFWWNSSLKCLPKMSPTILPPQKNPTRFPNVLARSIFLFLRDFLVGVCCILQHPTGLLLWQGLSERSLDSSQEEGQG